MKTRRQKQHVPSAKARLEALRRRALAVARPMFTPDATGRARELVAAYDAAIKRVERAERSGDRAAMRRALREAERATSGTFATEIAPGIDALVEEIAAAHRGCGELAATLFGLSVQCPGMTELRDASRACAALMIALRTGRTDVVQEIARIATVDPAIEQGLGEIGVFLPGSVTDEWRLLGAAWDQAMATFTPVTTISPAQRLVALAQWLALPLANAFEQCAIIRREASSAVARDVQVKFEQIIHRRLTVSEDRGDELRTTAIRACLRAVGSPEKNVKNAFQTSKSERQRELAGTSQLGAETGTSSRASGGRAR